MTRPAHPLWPVVVAAAALAAMTGCRGVSPDMPLVERVGDPIGQGWSAELPEGYEGWSVQIAEGCVLLFAWSTALEADEASRALRCHDPEGGALRWERVIPVPAGFVYDKIHLDGDRIIYQNNQQMIGLEADTGQVAWTFDPGGRSINETFVADGAVVTSLNRDTLVTLDASGGRWQRGVSVPDHRLVGLTRAPRLGALALVVLDAASSDPDEATQLAAVKLDVKGGTQPRPPFASMATVWRLPIKTQTYNIHVIDGVAVGHLSSNALWGVDIATGQVLYKALDGKTAASDDDEDVIDVDIDGLDELASLRPGDLRAARRVQPDHISSLSPGSIIVSQGHRDGVLMQLLQIQARDPRDFAPAWSLQTPSREFFRVQRELDGLNATFFAGARFALLVDTRTGARLWSSALDDHLQGWTSIATEGRGLYVVTRGEPTPRLEAHPIW